MYTVRLVVLPVAVAACVVGCASPLAPPDEIGPYLRNSLLPGDAARTYTFNVRLYAVGGERLVPAGHAQLKLTRENDTGAYGAVLTGKVMNTGSDASSVGFFQMRVGIWESGEFAGYSDASTKFVKFTGETLMPDTVAEEVLASPGRLSVRGFDPTGALILKSGGARRDDDPRS